MTLKYEYFVSMSIHENGKTGFANVGVVRTAKIKSIEDVTELARDIEKEQGFTKKSVVILNYREF